MDTPSVSMVMLTPVKLEMKATVHGAQATCFSAYGQCLMLAYEYTFPQCWGDTKKLIIHKNHCKTVSRTTVTWISSTEATMPTNQAASGEQSHGGWGFLQYLLSFFCSFQSFYTVFCFVVLK